MCQIHTGVETTQQCTEGPEIKFALHLCYVVESFMTDTAQSCMRPKGVPCV